MLGAEMNLSLFSHLVFGKDRMYPPLHPVIRVLCFTYDSSTLGSLGAKPLDFLSPDLMSVPGTFKLHGTHKLSVLSGVGE